MKSKVTIDLGDKPKTMWFSDLEPGDYFIGFKTQRVYKKTLDHKGEESAVSLFGNSLICDTNDVFRQPVERVDVEIKVTRR